MYFSGAEMDYLTLSTAVGPIIISIVRSRVLFVVLLHVLVEEKNFHK